MSDITPGREHPFVEKYLNYKTLDKVVFGASAVGFGYVLGMAQKTGFELPEDTKAILAVAPTTVYACLDSQRKTDLPFRYQLTNSCKNLFKGGLLTAIGYGLGYLLN
ncbi:hypothetical protein HY638_04010 [Candidatus Woesearchaeota archaeon]|nr:hypothetical protein [Candidatus Woesearchaeota archaeon]